MICQAGEDRIALLDRLSPEQMAFIETFIRCEGRLNRVQEEMAISYPTARGRLIEVIRALGYDVVEEPAPIPVEDRKVILEQLARGEISSQAAVELLKGK